MKIWKEIPLHELIPERGNVNSRTHYEINKEGEIRSYNERSGYKPIALIQKGNLKYFVAYTGTAKPFIPVHRIVAHVFIRKITKDDIVTFRKLGNPLGEFGKPNSISIRADNLKVISRKKRSENIKRLRRSGYTLQEIGELVNLHKGQVSIILNKCKL